MAERMIISVDSDGAVQITVQGVKGRSCKNVSAAIEKALGRVTSDKATGEMNDPEVARVSSRG